MLTKYDEYPVHQSPYPFSRIPITDYSFDDGYYFGFFNPDERLFLFCGLRVNPNADMIGGYAGVMAAGRQYTVRFKRPWTPVHDTAVGPFSLDVVEAFRDLHLALDENDSALSFDLHWLGAGEPFLEAHHDATNRQRVTTDQSRYSQPGRGKGWINFDGVRYEVTPDRWFASRDHSWGLYYERPPLAPEAKWMRPRAPRAARRALRLWTVFSTPTLAGFFSVHEAEDGSRDGLNDTFGTPFEGQISDGFDSTVELVDIAHTATFDPGRVMRTITADLTDADGLHWRVDHEAAMQPWYPQTIGYDLGSWRDGGSIYTYAGTDDPVLEWDDFDLSVQPFDFTTHDGRILSQRTGLEYLSRITVTAPDGRVAHGAGQTELFAWAGYQPYFGA